MMKPPTAEKLMSDPSKLSLTNPKGGECHLTKWIEVEGGKEDPLKIVSTDIQYQIIHSTLAFFAHIGQARGLKISVLNTITFLDFLMLHNRNENSCFNFELCED